MISFCFYGCHKDVPAPLTAITTNYGGTNGTIYAFTIYNGNLVIGGNFTMAGNISAQNIVLWDGSNWSAIGALRTEVIALTVYHGQLIAGLSDGNIMQWNGASWTSIGKVFKSPASINAFAEYNGNLIVCGVFDSITGLKASNIAQWNGSTWSALGVGINIGSSSLAVYNQNLIVSAGSNVEQWNGTSWTYLGKTDLNTGIQTVYTDTINNTLIAVGDFDSIAGVFASYAAQWNGTAWIALDKTHDIYSAWSVDIFDGTIVVVSEIGGISSLNRNAWTEVGSTYNGGKYMAPGFNYASIVYKGYLYVGGVFVSLKNSDLSVNNIARWNGASWSTL